MDGEGTRRKQIAIRLAQLREEIDMLLFELGALDLDEDAPTPPRLRLVPDLALVPRDWNPEDTLLLDGTGRRRAR